jgi:hypothetical protein
MVDFYEHCGVDGMTVLGIMGEAPKLDADESVALVKRIVGRTKIPVIVGVSAPGFAAMRGLARASMDAGAGAVMIAPPPALRTDDQITGYFHSAIEAIGDDIPWVLQDYPLTLSVVMTPGVIRRIVNENASCVMLKHEDWPGLEKITALRGFQSNNSMRPISILTGNGGLFLDFEMERKWRHGRRRLRRHFVRQNGAPQCRGDGDRRGCTRHSRRPLHRSCSLVQWRGGAPPSVAGLTFVAWQEPVGCGGVAIFPADIIVADEDGVVVIPSALLDEVVAEAAEQERAEGWIMEEVGRNVPLPGLYPMNAETKARYEAWKNSR